MSDRLHVYGSDKVKEWLTSSASFKHPGHIPTWKQILRECKYNGSVCTSDPRTRASNHFLNYAQHAAVHTIACYCSLTASIHAAPTTQPPGAVYARLMQWFTQNSTVHARTGILFLWRIGILFCFHCEPQTYRMPVQEPSAVAHLKRGRVLYCKMLTDINLEP